MSEILIDIDLFHLVSMPGKVKHLTQDVNVLPVVDSQVLTRVAPSVRWADAALAAAKTTLVQKDNGAI